MFFTKAALTAGPALLTSIPMVTCAGPVHFPFSCWTTPAPRLNSLSHNFVACLTQEVDTLLDEHSHRCFKMMHPVPTFSSVHIFFSLLLRSDSCSFFSIEEARGCHLAVSKDLTKVFGGTLC